MKVAAVYNRLVLLFYCFYIPGAESRMFFAADAVKMLRLTFHFGMGSRLRRVFLQIRNVVKRLVGI